MQSQETEEQLNTKENQLDMERQYLDVIYQKYILVYYVDLDRDSAKVVKLDPHANVWKMPGMRPGRDFDYTNHIKTFAELFIKDSKQIFQQMLSCPYIIKRLKKVSRYAFRFVGFQNLAGNCNYEVQVMRANPDVFDGKAIVVSEEIDDVIFAEQQRQLELETERLYLDVLTQDFASIYHVDLYKGTSKMIKMDTNRYRDKNAVLRREYNYQERIETYCANYVIPELQKDFKQAMKAKNILQQLKNTSRYVYRYRTNQQYGQQYFEMNALRMDDDPQSKNVLVAFRCIDSVVTAEEQRQIELQERLEREHQQNEVLSALGSNYHAIFQIDLEKDFYKKISCRSEISQYYEESEPSANRMLAEMCRRSVTPEYLDRVCHFFDMNTLAHRLRHRESVEMEYVNKEGNWHRARLITKHRDENGKVIHVLYVTQSIDVEKQHEERLIADVKYAEDANQAKTEFISQVAHDIRTPMNSILGFLEIAQSNLEDSEKVKHSLEMIRLSGEFLKDLVDDVLDISRMEKGVMKICPETVNFTELMENLYDSLLDYQKGKKQDFRFEIYDVLHDQIVVDPLRLKQIYTNVLSNAVKYTPDGGNITFTVSQQALPDAGMVRLVADISDNGIGMSEEFMKKMFNKFERATDTRVNTVSGYGLGLSIVKQLVDLMGGSLEVKSRLVEGTSVCISLDVPCASEESAEKEISIEEYAAVCNGMHLLVAEDNELNREVITELLSMYGITCECAEDGKICLERLQAAGEGVYDAVLMDMQMPNMNGLEATKAIRALPFDYTRTIPIIAMTANALKRDIRECLEAGMDRHLSKPIDMKKMLQALAETKRKRG